MGLSNFRPFSYNFVPFCSSLHAQGVCCCLRVGFMFPKSGEVRRLEGFSLPAPQGRCFLGSRDVPTEVLHPSMMDSSPPSFSISLETPGLGECNSDFMYTTQLLKEIKERLCFKQQERKPSAVFITSPLLSLSVSPEFALSG